MNTKKIVKFNIYMSFILLGVLVLMLVTATLAYFSDYKQVTNTMTAGNVEIALSESAVKPDGNGNLVADPSAARIFGTADMTVNDYGKIYPSQSIFKDPTVTNTGAEPAWIAAKVTLTDGQGDLTKVMGYEGFEGIDIEVLLGGGLLDERVHVGKWNGLDHVCYNDRYAMVQVPNARDGEFSFYFFMLNPIQGGNSVMLFDSFYVPDEWNNAEMQQLKELKINVEAFGVQINNLESCFVAMTDAFPTYFDFN